MGAENEIAVTEFILEGFPELDPRLQVFFSQVLLLMYLTTVMGNATIIFLVCVDHHLQTPRYFFISNLAFLEIWFTSSTSIKLFVMLSSGQNTLSLSIYFAQNYFYFALGCTEFILLVVMSFDCYVAICQPLLYAAIMKPQLCVHLVVAAWVLGFVLLSYRLLFLLELSFCGSKIPHFLCDNSPLFKLSCSDTSLLWKIDSVFISRVVLGSLCLTLAFYIATFSVFCILPAASGRKKALTTCSSHLITLSIAYGSFIALYTCPAEDVSLRTNRIVALLNTVLYPFLNPFIYSLRNKSVILVLSRSIAKARTKLFP
ncbi:LOW QUALITY PROTEIN: olfactory receptor 6M1-like [Passer montanus]|uniref:LOW QUALITY PROTEIN: olfactory receptor 6M1-like n=1 Tax=Passer montanus TaxID=9160 RepID=UPI001961F92D|nr:LOW QUALITY PROTEIN: olfactory receptor 6M1-like [Passer montanus]